VAAPAREALENPGSCFLFWNIIPSSRVAIWSMSASFIEPSVDFSARELHAAQHRRQARLRALIDSLYLPSTPRRA
jgi:hypothetical protein